VLTTSERIGSAGARSTMRSKPQVSNRLRKREQVPLVARERKGVDVNLKGALPWELGTMNALAGNSHSICAQHAENPVRLVSHGARSARALREEATDSLRSGLSRRVTGLPREAHESFEGRSPPRR